MLNQYRSDLAPYSTSLCIKWDVLDAPHVFWPFLHCTSAFLSVSYTASPSQLNQMVRPNECSISPVRPSYVQNTEWPLIVSAMLIRSPLGISLFTSAGRVLKCGFAKYRQTGAKLSNFLSLMKKVSEDVNWYQSLRIVCYSMCTLRFAPGRTVYCMGIEFIYFFSFGHSATTLLLCGASTIHLSLRGEKMQCHIFTVTLWIPKKREATVMSALYVFGIFLFYFKCAVWRSLDPGQCGVQLGLPSCYVQFPGQIVPNCKYWPKSIEKKNM